MLPLLALLTAFAADPYARACTEGDARACKKGLKAADKAGDEEQAALYHRHLCLQGVEDPCELPEPRSASHDIDMVRACFDGVAGACAQANFAAIGRLAHEACSQGQQAACAYVDEPLATIGEVEFRYTDGFPRKPEMSRRRSMWFEGDVAHLGTRPADLDAPPGARASGDHWVQGTYCEEGEDCGLRYLRTPMAGGEPAVIDIPRSRRVTADHHAGVLVSWERAMELYTWDGRVEAIEGSWSDFDPSGAYLWRKDRRTVEVYERATKTVTTYQTQGTDEVAVGSDGSVVTAHILGLEIHGRGETQVVRLTGEPAALAWDGTRLAYAYEGQSRFGVAPHVVVTAGPVRDVELHEPDAPMARRVTVSLPDDSPYTGDVWAFDSRSRWRQVAPKSDGEWFLPEDTDRFVASSGALRASGEVGRGAYGVRRRLREGDVLSGAVLGGGPDGMPVVSFDGDRPESIVRAEGGRFTLPMSRKAAAVAYPEDGVGVLVDVDGTVDLEAPVLLTRRVVNERGEPLDVTLSVHLSETPSRPPPPPRPGGGGGVEGGVLGGVEGGVLGGSARSRSRSRRSVPSSRGPKVHGDADGRVVLRAPAGFVLGGFSVLTDHGHVPVALDGPEEMVVPTGGVVLPLAETPWRRGPDGAPSLVSSVELWDADGTQYRPSSRDGVVRFQRLPRGRYWLQATRDGFVHAEALDVDSEVVHVTPGWRALPESVFEGHLLDPDGAPGVRVDIALQTRADTGTTELPVCGTCHGETGLAGFFSHRCTGEAASLQAYPRQRWTAGAEVTAGTRSEIHGVAGDRFGHGASRQVGPVVYGRSDEVQDAGGVAGIEVGDRIVAVDGESLAWRARKQCSADPAPQWAGRDRVPVTLTRGDGEPFTVEVPL